MRLSTSTNLFITDFKRDTFLPFNESIQRCYDVGFRVLDANLADATTSPERRHPLTQDNWRQTMEEARNLAERLGIVFTQSHLPYDKTFFLYGNNVTDEYKDFFLRMTQRAIEASAILGVKWAVVHPWTNTLGIEHDIKTNLKTNYDYYAPIIDFAKHHQVGLAMENMLQSGLFIYRFATRADELIACIDQFKDSAVGACWDFGHGNVIYRDQSHPLRQIGKRLKALHVDDNYGDRDAHLLPFVGGTVDWPMQMQTLKEIGYEGDFTYEIQNFTKKIPVELWLQAGRLAYDMGMHLLSL